jgi:hypothetical protein
MSADITVTVDGEPVVAIVTLDQVREYLRGKGWARTADEPPHLRYHGVEVWSPRRRSAPRVWLGVLPGGDLSQNGRDIAVLVARHEGRTPAVVLREIAGVGAAPPVGVEPLRMEEIATVSALVAAQVVGEQVAAEMLRRFALEMRDDGSRR